MASLWPLLLRGTTTEALVATHPFHLPFRRFFCIPPHHKLNNVRWQKPPRRRSCFPPSWLSAHIERQACGAGGAGPMGMRRARDPMLPGVWGSALRRVEPHPTLSIPFISATMPLQLRFLRIVPDHLVYLSCLHACSGAFRFLLTCRQHQASIQRNACTIPPATHVFRLALLRPLRVCNQSVCLAAFHRFTAVRRQHMLSGQFCHASRGGGGEAGVSRMEQHS